MNFYEVIKNTTKNGEINGRVFNNYGISSIL